jgi:hypothetical protein
MCMRHINHDILKKGWLPIRTEIMNGFGADDSNFDRKVLVNATTSRRRIMREESSNISIVIRFCTIE